jgi:radical SAM protein with 4Fe4S-binding SPASM domain
VRVAGGRIVAVFVATKLNLPQWEETIRLCLALGVAGILFNRFNPGGEGIRHMDELLPCPDDLAPALRAADEAVREFRIPIGIPVPIPPCTLDHREYRDLTFNGCLAGTANAYWTLDPMGNVRACNHSPTILGNVLRSPFQEVVSNSATRSWVSAVPSGCRSCRSLRRCRGGCKAASEVCFNTMERLDPFVEKARRHGAKT